ncbi:MAG: spherulation-specific family 4 protein [Tepidisphaeraceae bacterium]
MCRSSEVACSVFVSMTVALGVILQLPGSCRADGLGTIVPAYFYPGTGGPGGVGDGWAAMDAAAGQIQVTAIFNPDSGPLPGPPDPNYVTAMTNLETASGKAVGYVYTDNGSAPIASVEGQVSTYISQYGSLIDGFFLDGMSVTPSTLSYYQSLDSYIKGLDSSYTVIGNPGQPYLNGVSPSEYLSTADLFDIFEGPNTAPAGDPGFNNYPYGQNWFQSYPSDRFSNTIYDAPTTSAMLADLSETAQLNAGYVYVTDQTASNPYAQLPSYWDQEVSAIASLPEPSPLASSLVLGSLIALSVRWRGRLN